MTTLYRHTISLLLLLLPLVSCTDHDARHQAQGVFEADEILVSAVTSGEVLQLLVEEGEQVRRGDTLALIDTTFLTLQRDMVDVQQSTVQTAGTVSTTAQIAPLQAQLRALVKERDRYAPLVAEGIVPQRSLDEIEAKISAVEAQITAARSSIGQQNRSSSGSGKALTVQSSQVQEMIARSYIKAPISGTVLTLYLHQGELAAQGMPLMRIADMQQIYLRAYVTAEQLEHIQIGTSVSVRSDMGEQDAPTYPGTVSWISQRAEFTPKNIQTPEARASLIYAIKIKVPNDGRLRIGQYGRVELPH